MVQEKSVDIVKEEDDDLEGDYQSESNEDSKHSKNNSNKENVLIKKLKDFWYTHMVAEVKSLTRTIKEQPNKIVVSAFGMGFLKPWQVHWASFFAICVGFLVIYNSVGLDAPIVRIESVLFITAAFFLLIGSLSTSIYQKMNPAASEEIVIHIFSAQLLLMSITAPSVFIITHSITKLTTLICTDYLYCGSFIYKVMAYAPVFLIPKFVLSMVININPWPIAQLDLHYNNASSKALQGMVIAFYGAFFIHLVALIFFDIDLKQIKHFFDLLFSDVVSIIIHAGYNLDVDILDSLEDIF